MCVCYTFKNCDNKVEIDNIKTLKQYIPILIP